MTQMTPPGWYPDPGQAAGAPPTERWWDGNAWTDQVRAAGGAFTQPGQQPGQPAFPAYPAHPPAPRRRGLRVAIAAGAVLVVLAGIGGGVYALTSDDDGDGGSASEEASSGAPRAPRGSEAPDAPRSPESDAPRAPGAPEQEAGFATDPVNGIKIPIPDGWKGGTTAKGAGVQTDPIPCPGNSGEQCTRGSAFSQSAEELKLDAKTPEEAAKQDIAKNAKEGYGGKTYGRITSHKVLASKAITVAGQKGYYVRWKAVTEKSDDGYVQSLAFPSPADKDKIVVVRMGIDVNDKAPSLSAMDTIAKGIKAGPTGGGGGTGQDV
ncbi:DUF2510 domain-containing protein [Streptomyces alfalfae]|uniref:DUF2510 domain-containing protein n=1 Tax=Streptomyces alfalfae TaxID=1642299 RepID=A0A1P8TCA5_9ACTN|nr:DUF2510 domain-containing protein [Streptomyces alfalfae]AYA15602.1 DUF2510 domain-containing protein [Streptomyces fradiae]APY85255.1 hypothetical protein A7J05_05520 [Streptomyces alfalfae]QQC92436.1 DUF2510 domain-containing protein [Streptomyces alfalfae]QUI34939.1 DUF2510 domain-containing protein [Streptomyces alfalfae]RXX39078.1 DUF2510 domain-containing protein [Streptomyces alfalfae]